MAHAGVGRLSRGGVGCSGSCRGGVGHVGVGGSCRGGVGHVGVGWGVENVTDNSKNNNS